VSDASGKKLILIGTSGSMDYLDHARSDRRFWPVAVAAPSSAVPLSAEDRAIVDRLVALTPDPVPTVVGTPSVDEDGQSCDGLHDEDAPVLHLCSRCFPRGEIPAGPEEDSYDEPRRDDDGQME
jgi:hypothetical protein